MFWFDLISGAVLMLTGWAVYKNPMLISGVNTMSKKRLAQVNLEGLKHDYRNAFLICGGVLLLFGGISTFLHVSMGVHLVVFSVVLMALVVVCLQFGKKHDLGLQGEEGKKERRKNWIGLIITVVALGAMLVFFFKGGKPATIEVSEDYITAKGGGYSASIPIADIVTATTLNDWPDISMRTNGLATDKVGIGHFKLKNGEKCMMFVCVDGGPLLEVRIVDGKLYYLNCATEEETLEMIARVKELTNSKFSVASRHCEERSSLDNKPIPWIASSYLLAMTQSVCQVKAKGR